jgi:hypothetical protein
VHGAAKVKKKQVCLAPGRIEQRAAGKKTPQGFLVTVHLFVPDHAEKIK